jgi:large conductance mechanosensitive channel
MSFIKDFKAFAMKGSVIDLAVGVIIGGAFGKIVSAMVDDVLMPIIASLTGKGQLFSDKFIELPFSQAGNKYQSLAEAKKAGVNVFAYGHFIQTIFDFLIVAFFIFMVIRLMARMQRKEEAAQAPPPGPSSTDQLLMEIRDRLPKNQ